MVAEPYGGKLVNGYLNPVEAERRAEEFREVTALRSPVDCVYDADKIACGAYSPLTGFMTESEYRSVVDSSRLANGLPWTMPIVFLPLESQEHELRDVKAGDTVGLSGLNGEPFALISVEEKYVIDRGEFAQKVYGTKDLAHPNVSDLHQTGTTAVAGKVTCLGKLTVPSAKFELTPAETRDYFKKMGWVNVAAYQARNPPHTAHEYIQRITLERDDVDALMIQPVV
ncbi:MAG: sulfate adenylyltransferase, partial [Thermoprotei archaeon]